ARRRLLVRDIPGAENRLEHSFLVSDDKGILNGENDDRQWQEPEYPRDDDESHPDQEVANIEWIPDPAEDSVRHQALHVARASPRHRAGGRHAGESDRLPQYHDQATDPPAHSRHLSGSKKRNGDEQDGKPTPIPKEYGTKPGTARLFRG